MFRKFPDLEGYVPACFQQNVCQMSAILQHVFSKMFARFQQSCSKSSAILTGSRLDMGCRNMWVQSHFCSEQFQSICGPYPPEHPRPGCSVSPGSSNGQSSCGIHVEFVWCSCDVWCSCRVCVRCRVHVEFMQSLCGVYVTCGVYVVFVWCSEGPQGQMF